MSAIFYHNEEQKRLAEETFKVYEAKKGKVQTQVLPATTFYDAEEYDRCFIFSQ
jgi:peptide methionine sulfoxide reductase MsrA